jgi:hypothetical protein
MQKFYIENKKKLEPGTWFLVKCPEFCQSKFEVAYWDGDCFVSQANGEDITETVIEYTDLETGVMAYFKKAWKKWNSDFSEEMERLQKKQQ